MLTNFARQKGKSKMTLWIWLIVALLAGAAAGAAGVWWYFAGRAQTPKYQDLVKQQEQFKTEVTDHFVETARLINQLTDSYKAVFDHLSEGADQLVEPDTLRERLPAVSDKEVRLKRIGAGAHRRRQSSDDAGDDPMGI